MKKTVLLVLALSLFALAQGAPASGSAAAPDTLRQLTIGELAKYNGKDGAPAYVAVDSVVYDVTGVRAWKKGAHKGGTAGTDISAKIAKAPHGKRVLKKRKIVGRLVTPPQDERR
jgi:predicted heme/steroid binding protein